MSLVLPSSSAFSSSSTSGKPGATWLHAYTDYSTRIDDPFLASLQPWLRVDAHHLETDAVLSGASASPTSAVSSMSGAPIRLLDPSALPLPEQGVFHNAAAVAVSVQVLAQAPVSFQLQLLQYVHQQTHSITVNQALLCGIDIVSSLVHTYRELLLQSTSEADHFAAVRQRRATAVERPPSHGLPHQQQGANNSDPALDERRALVLAMVRTFATFSCSGNDVRAVVSLLNAPQPRWQVALDLLIDAVQTEQHAQAGGSAVGPYVQFHLARKGLACLHVPVLSPPDRGWPPSSGYSFAAWLYIDRFGETDNDTPLRLLSMASADSRSITDAYIRHRHLVLQTSAKQVVTLDQFRFDERRWYHVVLTHTKHIITTSTVRLFVDGRLVQTERLSYVSSASAAVSAWIGTPPQYQVCSRIQWRLASFLFLDDALPEERVSRLHRDGPSVAGLMHSASKLAAVDVLEPFYARANSIAEAFRGAQGGSGWAGAGSTGSASTSEPSVPFDQIVLMIHAQNVMQAAHLYPSLGVYAAGRGRAGAGFDADADAETKADLERARQADAAGAALWQALDPHDQLLLNAGCQQATHAIVRGDVHVYHPVSLADALRQIGGLRVLLPLFERRLSQDALRKVLILVALLLRDSPKTLREVDQVHGYALIGHLLKRQRVPFDLSLHELLASFCGLAQSCTAGQIAAPAAFQAFLLDFSLWQRSPPAVQQLLFQGLLAAIRENPLAPRHAHQLRSMNVRALISHSDLFVVFIWYLIILASSRCHLQTVSWALSVLADPKLPEEVMPHVVALIKALLLDNLSVEDLQQVADMVLAPAVFEDVSAPAPNSGGSSSASAPSRSQSLHLGPEESVCLSFLSFFLSPWYFQLFFFIQCLCVVNAFVHQRSVSPVPSAGRRAAPSAPVAVRLRSHSPRALLVRHLLLHALLLLTLQLPAASLLTLLRVLDVRWLQGVLDAAPDDKHPVGAALLMRLLLLLCRRGGADWVEQFRRQGGFAALPTLLRPYVGCGAVMHALLLLLFGPTAASVDPLSLLPLRGSLEVQDELSLDLDAMLNALEDVGQPVPDALAIERVLGPLGPAVMNAPLLPEALHALLSLLHHSMTSTATITATVARRQSLNLSSSVSAPPGINSATVATATSSVQPSRPLQTAPAAPVAAPSRFESFFSMFSSSEPAAPAPAQVTAAAAASSSSQRPPPPSVPAPSLHAPGPALAHSLRDRAVHGGLTVTIANPNSAPTGTSQPPSSAQASWSPQTSPSPVQASLFRHLPPASVEVENRVIGVLFELFRVSEPLRQLCASPRSLLDIAATVIEAANSAQMAAFNSKKPADASASSSSSSSNSSGGSTVAFASQSEAKSADVQPFEDENLVRIIVLV